MRKQTLILYSVFFISTINIAKSQVFDKEGHRGCRGLMPENSIPAMKKAVDLGATLEMDISFSQEKTPIVSHDQYISSAIFLKPNGDTITLGEEQKLALYQMPYDVIRQYVMGGRPNPRFPQQKKIKTYIPKLADLIDSVEAYAKKQKKSPPKYNIETKTTPEGDNLLHPAPEEFVKLLMNVIVAKGIEKRVIIQSFDPRTLEIVHKKYPAMQTALLAESKTLNENLAALTFLPTIYSPDYTIIDQKTVTDCHHRKVKIIPWTVNDEGDISRLKAWGVDGIISDYPDRL